jgi:hypothetical protein
MAPLRLAFICGLAVLLLAPQAAPAGGWWSHIEVSSSTVAPGQRVEVDDGVAFDTIAAADEARDGGRFYVYLLRGFDDSALERAMRKRNPGDWWSLGDAVAIRVGRLALSVSDGNMGRATASFTVPDLRPGTYHLMLCDASCAQPLADTIPTAGFRVVADLAAAQPAQRVLRVEQPVWEQAGRLVAGALAVLLRRMT